MKDRPLRPALLAVLALGCGGGKALHAGDGSATTTADAAVDRSSADTSRREVGGDSRDTAITDGNTAAMDTDVANERDVPGSDAAGACAFSATYTFYDDGGNSVFVYHSNLTPPRTHTLEKLSEPINDGVACPRELPCASATAITVPQIEAAISNADVQAALAKPNGMLYGTDPRPSDGTVWVFERNDDRGFMVGSGTVPEGLGALEALLHRLNTEALASECSALAQ